MSAHSNSPGEDPQAAEDRPTDGEDLTLAHKTQGVPDVDASAAQTLELRPKSVPKIPGLKIGSLLGAGAMGEVFAGTQEYLNREVAIKMLGERCSGASYQSRFKREATLLAGLTHENIVACYDAGIAPDGRCFLVMERVHGPSLGTWVSEQGPLSPRAALRVIVELARALQHAHRKCTLIHRDVKPANVLLAPLKEPTDDGFPFSAKLADLGLARPADAEHVDMALTAEGVILGTPSTMAPEQFDDPSGVDRRADIYALGCVLFFSLTGRSAFRGRTLSQVVQAKWMAQAPDAQEIRPDVPASLAHLAQRMMSAKAADRPQRYQELLEACAGLELDPVVPVGSANMRVAAGVGILVLLVGAYGYWKVTSSKQPGEAAGPEQDSRELDPQARSQTPANQKAPPVTGEPAAPVSEAALTEAAPLLIEAPQLDWPREVLAQGGEPVLLEVSVQESSANELELNWQWETSLPTKPKLNSPQPLQLKFEAPRVETVQTLHLLGSVQYAEGQEPLILSCMVRVFPSAEPLKNERSLIVAQDYGVMPRYWAQREGGTQFGQLSADEGLFCKSTRRRTLHSTDLPGGSWTFTGTLAVSEGETVPDRIGLVVTHPHGRRHEFLVAQGKPAQLVLQSYTRSAGGSDWSAADWLADGEPRLLGPVSLGEPGVPLRVAWANRELVLSAGDLSLTVQEAIAPETLAFSVQGGAGELRIPKLLPPQ